MKCKLAVEYLKVIESIVIIFRSCVDLNMLDKFLEILNDETPIFKNGMGVPTTLNRVILDEMDNLIGAEERSTKAYISEVRRLFEKIYYVGAVGEEFEHYINCDRKDVSYCVLHTRTLYFVFMKEFDDKCEDWGYGRPLSESRLRKRESLIQGITNTSMDASKADTPQELWRVIFEVRDIVRDMESLAIAMKNNNEDIHQDSFNRNLSGSELHAKCVEASLHLIPREKRNNLYSLGEKMRRIMAYIKTTEDSKMIDEICLLSIDAISNFYNVVEQNDPEELKTDCPSKSVADGLLAVQEIQQIRDNTIATELCDNTPNVEVQKDATTSPYYNLTTYIDGGTESIEYMMKYKQPRDGVKRRWRADKGDALLLYDVLKWTIPEINKCICFKGGKPLSLSCRKKGGESPLLLSILKGMK